MTFILVSFPLLQEVLELGDLVNTGLPVTCHDMHASLNWEHQYPLTVAHPFLPAQPQPRWQLFLQCRGLETLSTSRIGHVHWSDNSLVLVYNTFSKKPSGGFSAYPLSLGSVFFFMKSGQNVSAQLLHHDRSSLLCLPVLSLASYQNLGCILALLSCQQSGRSSFSLKLVSV